MVTNSPAQLNRLVQAAKGQTPTIRSLDEYKFFRLRYPRRRRGDRTGFPQRRHDPPLVQPALEDFRIAPIRERSVLNELQADKLDELVHGQAVTPGTEAVQFTSDGVLSPVQGTLAFQTPVVELSMDKVSKAEADAYVNWRRGYEQGWRWAFDPIALHLRCG